MLVLDRSAGQIVASRTVKKSRFVATLMTVGTQEEFRALRREIADAAAASHACWAVVLGTGTGQITRSGDDGEPAGTAGPPILAALEAREVVDAGIVVVRYYGGIQLGTGGLIRAYGGTAAAALEAAPLRSARLVRPLSVRIPMHDAGRVAPILHAAGDVRSVDYTASGVDYRVEVRAADADGLCDQVRSITSGAALITQSASRLA